MEAHGLDTSFVPDACALPTADQPLRLAEFENLFAGHLRSVVRLSPARLSLRLDGDPAAGRVARDLAQRESACCSFFSFTFAERPESGALELEVGVPDAHAGVLDGLERLAMAAATAATTSTTVGAAAWEPAR